MGRRETLGTQVSTLSLDLVFIQIMGEGGVIQTLRSGGGRAGFKIFFRPFGPQFGLKIRRGPGPGCVESHFIAKFVVSRCAFCILWVFCFVNHLGGPLRKHMFT